MGVLYFDQINRLFDGKKDVMWADVSGLWFPFCRIGHIVEYQRITSVICATTNNEVVFQPKQERFRDFDHKCSMSKEELQAVFHEELISCWR